MGEEKQLPKKKLACRTPSVQKCLHCTEPECTCKIGISATPDEIEALKLAGMYGNNSITSRYKRAEKELKSGDPDNG